MIRTFLQHGLGATAYWQRSLKLRVTLLTLAIFVVSIWTLAVYSSNALREDMQRQLGEQQFATVSAAAVDVDAELTKQLRVLSTITARITPAMLGNRSALQAYLQDRVIIQEEFNAGVLAVRLDGTVLANSTAFTASSTPPGSNLAGRPHIAAALRQGKSSVGLPHHSKTAGRIEFDMAVPILDAPGQVIGALIGVTDMGLPNFLDKISNSHYGDTGGYLLNAPQQRLVVTATDKSRVMQQLPAVGVNAMLDRFMLGFEGYGVAVNARGVEELTSAKGIPTSGWFLAIVIPTAEAFAPVWALRQRVLQSAVVLTLLAGALVWWMLRHQLAPLQASTVALARQLKNGQVAQALPIARADEIGALIAAFNQLLENLQENELRYRTVANFTVDWEYWILPNGTLRYVSPSCQEISGYSAEQLYADPQLLNRMVHPDDLPLFDRHVHQRSVSGVPLPIDFRILTQDGATRWLSHVCRPVFDEAGQALGLRASNRDITARKQVETALARSHADLQRFSEVTAHHLQEPARRISNYAARLTRQLAGRLDDAEAQLSLEFIGQQARRQQNLLRDIERYLAADQPRGMVAAVEVQAAVQALLVRWKTRIALTGAAITLGPLPAAWIDRPRLNDLFEVAIDNALNHGRSTEPLQILIEGKLAGGKACYSVSDNGPGVEAQYRDRVFRVFERLSPVGDSASTGIGLAILRRITENCGGSARLEASNSGGARLVFELATEKLT